jgi:modulator of drug activity B
MKKVLLLNGGKKFAHSDGRYNATLHDTAQSVLGRGGLDVKTTSIGDGYDLAEEVAKFVWADVIIYQMPGWWMGAPWTVKKYIDEVFTEGHGSLYASDGRTRSDATQKYGSGGLLQGKQYMLSLTWNAPQQAFDDPTDFFEGKGVDAVYFPFTRPIPSSA